MRACSIACLLWVLVACSPKATPTPVPVTIKLGTLPFLSNSVFQIAVDEGYFAQQGITVEMVQFKQSTEMIPLLVTGDLDVCAPAATAAFYNAVASGARIRIAFPLTVFHEGECASIALLARTQDVEAGKWQDPATWKGLRFASSAGLQGGLGYVAHRLLNPAGLTLDDISVDKVDSAALGEALLSGQYDIVYAVEPWVTQILAMGGVARILPAEQSAPGYVSSTILYGARLLDNPEIGMRFGTAYLQAVRQYLNGKTPRNVEISAAYTGMDAAVVSDICWTWAPPDGKVEPQALADFQAYLLATGQVDQVLTAEQVLDTRFASEAVRVLGRSSP
jgi:NitT/TauT family transport system substrate-binding protein